MQDARNEDRSAMKADLVVDGAKQLMQNVFMKSNYDGVAERLISLDLEHVFLMPRCPRIKSRNLVSELWKFGSDAG